MLVAGNQVFRNTATEKSRPSVSVTAFYASFVRCFDTVSLIYFFFPSKMDWVACPVGESHGAVAQNLKLVCIAVE